MAGIRRYKIRCMRQFHSENPPRQAPQPASKPAFIWLAVAVALLAGIIYLPAMKYGFVWDDHVLVVDNQGLARATPLAFFGQSFTHWWASQGMGPHAYYRPLPVLSFWLEKKLWGPEPMGFHLTNIILNSAVSALVALLFAAMLGSGWPALLAGLAFALHASHVESVAFVAGRTDILMALFAVAGFLCLLRYRHQRKSVWLASTVVGYALALLCKETAFLFPLLALLVLSPRLGHRRRRRDWMLLALLAVVAALCLAVRSLVLRGPAASWGSVTVVERLLLVLNSFGRYALYSILPFFHRVNYPDMASFARFGWPTIAAVAALAAVGWMAVSFFMSARRTAPAGGTRAEDDWLQPVVIGSLWFVLFVLPACNLFPPGPSYLAERMLYLPTAGAIMALFSLGQRIARTALARRVFGVIACGYILAMGVSTARWLPVWRNDLTLQVARTREMPGDASSRAALAGMLREQKDPEGALRELRRAVELRPDSAWLRASLAEVLKGFGDAAGAERELRTAISLNPGLAEVQIELGNLLVEKGDVSGAIDAYRRGLALAPQHPMAHNNLGVALQQAGDVAGAEAEYRRALKLQPGLHLAHNNLGEILLGKQERDSAIARFRAALASRPGYALARYNLCAALLAAGRAAEAESELRRLLQQNPDFPGARQMLDAAVRARK
jgi:Flp pilus assembly protein TadD